MFGYKSRQLEEHRHATLWNIRMEKEKVDVMMQRARIAGDIPDPDLLLKDAYERLGRVEQRAKENHGPG